MSKSVEREVGGIELGGEEAAAEEPLELVLLERQPGVAGLGRDPEHRGVGAAILGAVDAHEGVKGTHGAPVGVGGRGQRNLLDALRVLDGLGFAYVHDEAFFAAADVTPGKDFLEIDLFPGGREEITRSQQAKKVDESHSF